jgi:hypothetical protein
MGIAFGFRDFAFFKADRLEFRVWAIAGVLSKPGIGEVRRTMGSKRESGPCLQ